MTNSAASSLPASPVAPVQPKPRFAIFIATAAGLGYLPKAPGTWGSLAGLVPATLPWLAFYGVNAALGFDVGFSPVKFSRASFTMDPFLFYNCALLLAFAIIGVWSAGRASRYWQQKDPQRVVIDEVSGQHLTLLLGCLLPVSSSLPTTPWTGFPIGLITVHTPLNWKYLLLGFILFRGFDIWKPFPARQAESLPGGWGIMADDWIAGIYAALGLWIARGLGF
ncbi:MAG: phosphatidylglycerophosphatase A family protein [Candidatus Acidiferrales bacterium]